MSPGVRTIPAEMVLPTATAMPKPTPKIWRRVPFCLRGLGGRAGAAAAMESEGADNGGSQGGMIGKEVEEVKEVKEIKEWR
jgi:hypothetical protein